MSNLCTRSRRTDFSTRADGADRIISGYFVVFNQPYFVDGWEEEIVDRHAFDEADISDVRALVDHLSHLVLGRSTSNTLTFRIDDIGLYAEIRVNEQDQDAMNLYARIQRGDVSEASFGFWEKTVSYTDLPDGRVRRTILAIDKLEEISVCTFAAYQQTHVVARSQPGSRADLVAHKKESIKRRFKHHA